MTLYRLYLRSRIHREVLEPRDIRLYAAPGSSASSDQQERPAMICDDRRYSYVIGGREEFEAEHDAAALAIARMIRDAAGDCCDAFELWDGTRHIDQSRVATLPNSVIYAQWQEEILRTEEALLSSHWAIARSQRLLARFDEMRAAATAGEPVVPVASEN